MKQINRIANYLFIFTIILIFSGSAGAQTGDGKIIWKEGRNRIMLTISSDEIAELNLNSKGFSGKISARYKGSNLVYTSPGLRIWKIKSSLLKSTLKKGALPSDLKGNHTIILKEPSGRRRILTGNVVVMMKKNMTRKDVTAWAARKNLVIIKQVSKYSNSYLIKAPPGLASLNLAMDLKDDINVKSSSPDWCVDLSLK